MRHKRLNHVAETLCAMFCGWRLMNSYANLQILGSGVLEIDALELKCKFNGAAIEPLSIAHELNAWLLVDIQKHNIPASTLKQAKLSVTIDLPCSHAPSNPRGSFYIGKNGLPIEKGDFFKLKAQCKSEIKTDEKNYSVERNHYEQWPVGWPET